MVISTANDALNQLLETRWWALALRGVLGIVFGVICFASPAIAAFSLLLVFGAFSFADGVLGLMASFGQARRGERWVWLAVEAVASIVIGLLVLFMPGLSIVVLFLVIAIKTAITGIFLLLASIKLDGEHGQGWMAVSGLITLLFAGLLFLAPLLGAKILIWWIGAWAIVFGTVLVGLGFKLRSVRNRLVAR
jgi:uncharacterized membrane protein HdeD (DUF308 family)